MAASASLVRLAFSACGLGQEALPLGTPFSPKGEGAGGTSPCTQPVGWCAAWVSMVPCAPLRLARPSLTPTMRETASESFRAISFARKLPVQGWHGHHAAPAQAADKANAALVPQAGA